MFGAKAKRRFRPLQHALGCNRLLWEPDRRRLDANNNPVGGVDQIVVVVSELGRAALRRPVASGAVQLGQGPCERPAAAFEAE